MLTRTRFDGWRLFVLSVGVVALVFGSLASYAQGPGGPGGPGPQLNPEQQAKVWAIEAKAVAKELSLADDVTGKLVDAYKAARESQIAAMRAKMQEGGGQGGRPDMGAMREVAQAERTKFETAIKAFLKEDQVAKAMATLGSYNRRLDMMTMVLDEMKLDDAKGTEAMKLVMTYVAESDKLMRAAMENPGADREGMRDKMRALKTKLDEEMGKVLTAEQLKTWTEKTTMGGGGRRGPGAPAPGAAPAVPPVQK